MTTKTTWQIDPTHTANWLPEEIAGTRATAFGARDWL